MSEGGDNYGQQYDDIQEQGSIRSDDSQVEEDYQDQEEKQKNSNEQNSQKDSKQQQIIQDQEEEQVQQDPNKDLGNYQVIQQYQNRPTVPNPIKITSPYMTKFQRAKIIGIRAVQISKNAPLYLNSGDNVAQMNWDPITIAEKQLAQKKIPFIVRRYLPDGSYEDWKLAQLLTFD